MARRKPESMIEAADIQQSKTVATAEAKGHSDQRFVREIMKAISLWQFWASAIALGLKRNETRSWSTNHRGPIAIHAAKRDTRELRDYFNLLMCRGDFGQPFRAANLHSFTMLPKGAVVAVAELVEVVPTEVMLKCELVGDLEMNLGDYGINRFAWKLENIRPLREPYYIAGHQGFFDVPYALANLSNAPAHQRRT